MRGHADAVVGVTRRHGTTAAVALLRDRTILEVRRTRTPDAGLAIGSALRLAADYGARCIVTDRDVPPADNGPATVRVLPLSLAKQSLLGTSTRTHDALFAHVLKELPGLERFVTLLKVDGRVAAMKRRQTVILLAAAFALADLSPSSHPLTTHPL